MFRPPRLRRVTRKGRRTSEPRALGGRRDRRRRRRSYHPSACVGGRGPPPRSVPDRADPSDAGPIILANRRL